MVGHDVLVITESHLSGKVLDADVALPGFTLFRCDRSHLARKAGCGGVAVYVRNSLSPYASVLLTDNKDPGREVLWLRLALSNGRGLLLGACYLAPETSAVYGGRGTTTATREHIAEDVFGGIARHDRQAGCGAR